MSDIDDILDGVVRESQALVDAIKPLLAGRPAAVQSTALIQLVAIWAAGYPDFMREALVAQIADTVMRMIPIAEGELFGAAGHPGNKREER